MSQFTSKRRRINKPNMKAILPSSLGLSICSINVALRPCKCGHARIKSHGRYGNKKCQAYECDCKGYEEPPPSEQEVARAAEHDARIAAHAERIAWLREWGAGVGDDDDDPLVG